MWRVVDGRGFGRLFAGELQAGVTFVFLFAALLVDRLAVLKMKIF